MTITLLFASIIFVVILNFVQIKMLQDFYEFHVNKIVYFSISIGVTSIAWMYGNELIATLNIGMHFLALFGIVIYSFIKSNALNNIQLEGIRDRIIQSQNDTLIEPNSFSINVSPIFQGYVILFCLYKIFFIKETINPVSDDSTNINFQIFNILLCLYLSIVYLILKSKWIAALVLESKNKKNYNALKIKITVIIICTLMFYFLAKNIINITFINNLFDYKNIYLSFTNLAINYAIYLLFQLINYARNPFAFSVQTICKAIILYKNILISVFVTVVVCAPLLIISELIGIKTNTDPIGLLGFNITLLMTEYFIYKNKKTELSMAL